uniref:Uncharacterized protein n=1 Tax=Stegastes partitus TaxID=144197 RepID=A0A3B5B118_9TELE
FGHVAFNVLFVLLCVWFLLFNVSFVSFRVLCLLFIVVLSLVLSRFSRSESGWFHFSPCLYCCTTQTRSCECRCRFVCRT